MVAAADGSLTGQTPQGDTLRVREVWQDNLEAEMKVGAAAVVRRVLSWWVRDHPAPSVEATLMQNMQGASALRCVSVMRLQTCLAAKI